MESNVEDFFETEERAVFVSTIHKAKGREFDEVHLVLSSVNPGNEEEMRVNYVGMTRAQHRLCIHYGPLPTMSTLAMSLSMHDVWLGYFKAHQGQIVKLRSGDSLEYNDGYLLNENQERVASLSKAKRAEMALLEERGYRVVGAEVSYVLAWKPQDETRRIAILLCNLFLKKGL